jgi:hypothetical protein
MNFYPVFLVILKIFQKNILVTLKNTFFVVWSINRVYISLASRGLEKPAHASRGLEDFSVVCLAGCAVVFPAITTGKKKVPVVFLAGCQF